MDRRTFLRSVGGAALMLGVLAACHDESNGAKGKRSGGTYRVPEDAATDPGAAKGALARRRVRVRRADALPRLRPEPRRRRTQRHRRAGELVPAARVRRGGRRACFSVDQYLDLLFNQSDTSMMILTAIPIPDAVNPLSMPHMEAARHLADRVCGDGRVLLHGGVQPTVGAAGAQIDGMSALRRDHPIVGWKVYTHAPGAGWWLDDHDADAPKVGEAFLAQGRGGRSDGSCACTRASPAGASTPRPPTSVRRRRRTPTCGSSCTTRATRRGGREGPYDPDGRRRRPADHAACATPGSAPGGERLRRARLHVVEPDARSRPRPRTCSASCSWRSGPDNVLWGTDSLWYGSPQDQIQAFRAFEISPELQERYGYPGADAPSSSARSSARTRATLYGITAPDTKCEFSRDELAKLRETDGVALRTFGPETDRELRTLLASHAVI